MRRTTLLLILPLLVSLLGCQTKAHPPPTAPPALQPLAIETYLTEHEQGCRWLGGFIWHMIQARDRGILLTTMRAIVRESTPPFPYDIRTQVISALLFMADEIYGSPQLWGPKAPQEHEYRCLHPAQPSPNAPPVWR